MRYCRGVEGVSPCVLSVSVCIRMDDVEIPCILMLPFIVYLQIIILKSTRLYSITATLLYYSQYTKITLNTLFSTSPEQNKRNSITSSPLYTTQPLLTFQLITFLSLQVRVEEGQGADR